MNLPYPLLRWLGWSVTIAALVVVGLKILDQHRALGDWQLSGGQVAGLLGCALGYALDCFLLSFAWIRILRYLGVSQAPDKLLHGIYGGTQIAKYLPGNLFHLLGRHAAGRALGIGHKELAAAALLEVVGLVTASVSIGLLLLSRPALAALDRGAARGVVIAGMALLLAALLVVAWRKTGPLSKPRGSSSSLGAALLAQMIFFVASGWLFGRCVELAGPGPIGWTSALGTFSVAWLIGFIMPGAAGGLGVRELAMIQLLGPSIGEPGAMLGALMMRGVTLAGDVTYLGLTLPFRTKSRC